MTDFLHMGGYAFYVWTSYLLALFIVVLNLWLPLRRERTLKQRLTSQQRRQGRAAAINQQSRE